MKIQKVPRPPGQGLPKSRSKVRLEIPRGPAASAGAAARLAAAGSTPTQQQRGRLHVEPTEVREQADRLSALVSRAGGPLSGLTSEQQETQEDRHVVMVDALAEHVAYSVRRDLLRYEEVVRASGVKPEEHEARREQVSAASEAYTGAVNRDRDVEDSLRAVAHDNRRMREELIEVTPLAIEQGVLPEDELAIARSLWKRIQAELSAQQTRVTAERQQTGAENRASAEELGRAERRERLVRTMAGVQDPAVAQLDGPDAEELLRTYDELAADREAPATVLAQARADRRTSGR